MANQTSPNIRNFCIIAHIDHGKSTLADRLLVATGTVPERKMRDQILDSMDLERERGITIKLAPARMEYGGHILNLIDTPGHVDFNYEVSRSLAAVEGALLLVDATQGIQAQTLGNLHLAREQGLAIVPVVNKIDLPNADVPRTTEELCALLGCAPQEVLQASGKTGAGVPEILQAIVDRIPSPRGDVTAPCRALIFDSTYDEYKGVVAYVRMVDGELGIGKKIRLLATGAEGEALEVGHFVPERRAALKLMTGEIGYVVTAQKEIEKVRVGDTLSPYQISNIKYQIRPLPGYREVRSMVFAGLFPKDGDYESLRDAMGKLKLNDAALQYEPERSSALGFGFRSGFLGLLHLEIVQERLRREQGIELVVTTPSVAYEVHKTDGTVLVIKSPVNLPERSHIKSIEEPWVALEIITPKQYMGGLMQLVTERRGVYRTTEFLAGERAVLKFRMPLALILVDFYDKLKSVSSGFASMNYEFVGYREAEIVRLDILVAEELVEAFSLLVHESEAYRRGREIVEKLKDTLPRAQFEIKLQAAIGGKVIAAERIPPLRKDVLAKMSGGDWTRKAKLLAKQKKGKARMRGMGHVEIPSDAYLVILKH